MLTGRVSNFARYAQVTGPLVFGVRSPRTPLTLPSLDRIEWLRRQVWQDFFGVHGSLLSCP
jgi:hypothetical protein